MNHRDSITKNYSKNPGYTRIGRQRRRGKQTALFVMLIVLILILITAVVIIARDILNNPGGRTDPATPDSSSAPENTLISTKGHGADLAVDGSVATYMASSGAQKLGDCFTVKLENVVSIESVSVVSNHISCYLRSCEVRVSADGTSWTTIGTLTGKAANPVAMTVTTGPIDALYVRLVLTSDAAEQYVIHEITVSTSDGTSPVFMKETAAESSGIDVKPADTGTSSAGDVTTAPDGPATDYTTINKNSADIHVGDLVLVNNSNAYVFPTSTANIVDIYTNRPYFYDTTKTECPYRASNTKLSLQTSALLKLNELALAYYELTGSNSIMISDAYRSYEEQQEIATNNPASAAAAGYSDYHTAMAVRISVTAPNGGIDDLGSANGATLYAWLNGNAYKYGFIRRYPEDKDRITGYSVDRYHYRYVGYPHSYYMVQNNLCLEEYLALVATYEYSDKHLAFTADDGKVYEIYFVPASTGTTTSVPVPTSDSYTVSGNNYSGFVVTVCRTN